MTSYSGHGLVLEGNYTEQLQQLGKTKLNWYKVHGALVVNVGDILQLMTNDMIESLLQQLWFAVLDGQMEEAVDQTTATMSTALFAANDA
ncbi:hypothetical protein P8452_51028 [Trifolium repens]|nr:hypothetical protein P8452_51028 [Trifolium repens]